MELSNLFEFFFQKTRQKRQKTNQEIIGLWNTHLYVVFCVFLFFNGFSGVVFNQKGSFLRIRPPYWFTVSTHS